MLANILSISSPVNTGVSMSPRSGSGSGSGRTTLSLGSVALRLRVATALDVPGEFPLALAVQTAPGYIIV
jgi:hypothetical protein